MHPLTSLLVSPNEQDPYNTIAQERNDAFAVYETWTRLGQECKTVYLQSRSMQNATNTLHAKARGIDCLTSFARA